MGAVAVVALQAVTTAAQPPPTPVPAFSDAVEVRIANLEVRVTDRHGRPVTGLRREDFTLLEDGKIREIVNFAAYGGSPANPGGGAGGPAAVEDVQAAAASPVRLALFVDSFNLHVFNRKGVFRDLIAFVRERPAAISEMSLVSFDGRLQVRVPFTSDLAQVEAGLLAMEDEVGGGVAKEVAHKLAVEAVGEARSEAQALAAARAYAAEVRAGSQRTLLALREVVASLAGAKGRSGLLVVSDGFQLRAAEDLFERVAAAHRSAEAATEAAAFDVSDRFAELASYANASGVTFSTIGATGVQPPDHVSAQHGSPFSGFGAGRSVANARRSAENMLELMLNAGLREPLEGLAAETGGRSMINRASLRDDLRQLGEDFAVYYSLGFEPGPPADGRVRRIEVRVDRPGTRVRAPGSLRLKSAEEAAVDAVLAAVNAVAESNPIGFKVAVAPPPYDAAGDFLLVRLAFFVPARSIALLPDGLDRVGRVELVAAARDGEARLSAPVSVIREVRLPADAPDDQVCVLVETVQLRAGRNRLGLGVRDLAGGGTSTATVEVDASSTAAGAR